MKWLSWISGIVVLTIAALSFVLSFHALSVLGVQSKAFPPELAWIFPLIIDGAIVCFSLAALRAAMEKEPTRFYSLLIVAATLSSVVFNVLSIEEAVLGRVLAGFPPVLLAISFETFLRQLKSGLQESRAKWNRQREVTRKGPDKKKKVSKTKRERVGDRRREILQLQNEGKSAKEISNLLNISERTVFRDLQKLGENAA